jgi:hypothetical protein
MTLTTCVLNVNMSCQAATERVRWLPQAYFERQGFDVPMHANLADVYMDIVAGVMSRSPSRRAAGDTQHVHGAMSPPRGVLLQSAAEVQPFPSRSFCQEGFLNHFACSAVLLSLSESTRLKCTKCLDA